MPGPPGSLTLAASLGILLRVQLDDELLVDRRRLHVIALRHRHDLGLELFAFLFEPGYSVLALRDVAGLEHHGVLVHFFLDGHFLAHADEIRRNVDFLPVHPNMAVQHELPRLRARRRQTRAPHHVIQTALEHDDQVFAGRALGARGLLKIIAELPLQQAVRALDLLLLAQLQTVSGDLRAPRLPVLPRHEVALLNRALLRKATQAFQKQLLPFPAAQAADCISVSCQLLFSLPKTLGIFSLSHKYQTRRRFGGRQPLCGIGVTSRITTMWSPAAASARTADSRPEPGPFTRTSTLFIPYWSRATPAAASEACCAAYGVPLRDPLKPMAPAEDHHTTRPSMSVMEICVLLTVAAPSTPPVGTTRRSRFFLNSFLRFVAAAGFAGAPVSGVAPAAFGSFGTFHSDRAISLKLCQAGAQHCCAPTNL